MAFFSTSLNLSKYLSKSATKHLALTTKKAKKGYVKGITGMTKQGVATSKGGYRMDRTKMLELIPPCVEHGKTFKLKAYVGAGVPKLTPRPVYDASSA
jgi:hypothetical protein